MAGLKVWAYLSWSRWSVGRNTVSLGFFVDACTQVVRFWIVAWEKLNVRVDVGLTVEVVGARVANQMRGKPHRLRNQGRNNP